MGLSVVGHCNPINPRSHLLQLGLRHPDTSLSIRVTRRQGRQSPQRLLSDQDNRGRIVRVTPAGVEREQRKE